MSVKKSIINKDRFKNLSKISENEDEKENIVSRFDIDVKHESVSSVDVDKLKEAPSKWNFYSKLDDDKFLELVDSINNNSFLHPIVVDVILYCFTKEAGFQSLFMRGIYSPKNDRDRKSVV